MTTDMALTDPANTPITDEQFIDNVWLTSTSDIWDDDEVDEKEEEDDDDGEWSFEHDEEPWGHTSKED